MRVCVPLLAFLWVFHPNGLLEDAEAAVAERALTYRHFWVTDADGRVARVEPIAADPLPFWARNVSQTPHDWSSVQVPDQPHFEGPIPFVIPPPEGSGEPFYSHNHVPDIAWLPNGDLIAAWYTTRQERGTELTVLASRLRAGRYQWDPAYEFFRADERNMHCTALFYDDAEGLLHHFNGMGRKGVTGWAELAMVHRTSRDNGVTWTVAQTASSGANYQRRHMPIAGMVHARDGALILACDATPGGQGPTALHISRDGGRTWSDPGGDIRGIHAGVVELKDGCLMALSRGQAIDGYMPKSVSDDMGKTWTYSASPFPPIGGGQRLVLMRLREGPLMLVSFTSGDRHKPEVGHMTFIDQCGNAFVGHGMFAALSFDEGRTWPVRKLLTPGEGTYDGGAWTGAFTATPERAEHAGYLAATQTPDGVIHLISSRLHYRFNLTWLRECPQPKWHGETLTNSVGMQMIRIEPGTFLMGSEEMYKERPVHKVHITKPFYMSATQVTNEQYEQFDPEHRALRGTFGLSKDNDEAVLFVSWHDAVAFCEWLSQEEGMSYRLATEAEWEYAARAGTTTKYNTGDTLSAEFHRNQHRFVGAQAVPLHVGRTTPNAWGLYDMHGLVEEWVYDWYGPYTPEEKTDPVGRKDGTVKVTRGGSHGTPVEFLRSATRLGTLPEDRSWLIGFRVVRAEMPDTEPLPPEVPRRWARDVKQTSPQWGSKTAEPYFAGPQPFVRVPRGSIGPVYCRFADLEIKTNHVNHMPAVTWLDNGDLFAVWYSTTGSGRDMTTAASRFRAESEQWTEADVFFNAPGRNQTGSSVFTDRDGVMYWFNGLSAAQGHQTNNALIMSKSGDYGKTWSRPTLVNPDRNDPDRVNLPMDSVNPETTFQADGKIVIYSDNNTGRLRGGATVLMRIDLDEGEIEFSQSQTAGIHATAVQLKDGRMFAVGRTVGDTDNWDASKLPMSISHDGGNTWEHFDSEFPAIGHGQRSILMRLREGPLLLVSFAGRRSGEGGMLFEDKHGGRFRGYGMFAALSFDEGKTWPVQKLITPADGKTYDGQGATRYFTATDTQAEHRGYLTATQTPDGVIHLLSSGLHYRFNLAWLRL